MFLALGRDGRRAYADLADELGTTPKVVHRRLDRLRRNGDIAFRLRCCPGTRRMAHVGTAVADCPGHGAAGCGASGGELARNPYVRGRGQSYQPRSLRESAVLRAP
ncbi:AsnC family transcriptional regulator [Streptomyces sanglieri]|uniref:AsnC family transcriptional regulator n=1 Tax=Streptomyces sanglieri TaxID=193460 RepID=UPI0035260B01